MSIQPSNPETGFFSADNVEKPLSCQLQTQVVTETKKKKKTEIMAFKCTDLLVFLPF